MNDCGCEREAVVPLDAAKRVGRPRLFTEPLRPFSTRLPESVGTELDRIALERGISTHQVMREAAAFFVSINRQRHTAGAD